MNKQVVDVLNKQVANWSVLFTKLHHFHWYIEGPEFFTLHEKFEVYYDEAAEYIDELAERVLSIGGKPVSTMKEYLELSSIQESSGETSAKDTVLATIADFETVVKESKLGMEIAQEHGDEASSDMLLGIVASLEKHLWMLRAFQK